jgi:hypothetical protein
MKRDAAPVCLYAIYDSPRDFPNHVVVRIWQAGPEGGLTPLPEVLKFDITAMGHRVAMSAARGHCRRAGLTFLPRSKGDDPVIVETWKGRPKRIDSDGLEEDVGAGLRAAVIG